MRALIRLALVACTAAACATMVGCSPRPGGGGTNGARSLESTEVREYRGEDLSSIADFRENLIAGPQKVDAATYRLRISGLVATPTELTYDQVISRERYEKAVRLDCVEGWGVDILWEGVLVRDLLADAGGVKPGARRIIFRAADGYSTSFPVEYVTDNDILLAYRMNGVVLPEERGFPFQLVAEDKWGYKWIKWVTAIELSDDAGHKGYWESRGYSNDGDLDGPQFGP